MNRYSEIIENTYDDLAFYLKKIRFKEKPLSELEKKSFFYQQLNNSVKRINYFFKYFSAYGLVIPVISISVLIAIQELGSSVADFLINVFMASIFIKLFNVLVDLETRFIQYIIVIAITVFFAFFNPSLFLVPCIIALFFIILITFSRYAKHQMKLSALELMMHDPDGFGSYINRKNKKLLKVHKSFGISMFDFPEYYRRFNIKSMKKKRVVTPDSSGGKRSMYPPKGMVQVEIWQRNPIRDLSSIQEFFICCFLGGAQDSSAFEFIMSKSLTMLDMVSPRGRTIRVLLMACVYERKPVLAVNAVFGREGGLIGSLSDDNRFILDQIEAYARFTGFEKVIYNTTPTNKRPWLFIDYVEDHFRRNGKNHPERIKCRLTNPKDLIKLEIFNRSNPVSNIYIMLLLEIMNLTDNYAVNGRVTGYTSDLRNRFMQISDDVYSPFFEKTFESQTIETSFCRFKVDNRIAGENALKMLQKLFDPFPEMYTDGIPNTVKIAPDDSVVCLTGGSVIEGKILIHPAILSIENPFWRDVLLSAAVCQHILWRFYPVYNDQLIFKFIDNTQPDFNQKVIDSLVFLDSLGNRLETNHDTGFIASLIKRAVEKKYSAANVFKIKEIYLTIMEQKGDTGHKEPDILARGLFYDKLERNIGFREKYFQGLDDEYKKIVFRIMISELEKFFIELMVTDKITECFSLNRSDEIKQTIFNHEKILRKYSINIASDQEQRLNNIKERCKLLGKLADIKRLVEKNKIGDSLKALKQFKSKHRSEIKQFKLESTIRTIYIQSFSAPFNHLVEKLNQDMYW